MASGLQKWNLPKETTLLYTHLLFLKPPSFKKRKEKEEVLCFAATLIANYKNFVLNMSLVNGDCSWSFKVQSQGAFLLNDTSKLSSIPVPNAVYLKKASQSKKAFGNDTWLILHGWVCSYDI
ncbi:hypothetical protein TNCV_2317161 [Trichonephila clavipes]|nr:hypothetical protein TNCV_2317161 [Trichonephila clavipes]